MDSYTPMTFPINSRIRLPCGTVYCKLSNGEWHKYQSGALTFDVTLSGNYDFPNGSKMFYADQSCFVKHDDRWWPVGLSDGVSAVNDTEVYRVYGSEALHENRQSSIEPGNYWFPGMKANKDSAPVDVIDQAQGNPGTETSGLERIHILEQAQYRHGPAPIDDLSVDFLASMPSAARGEVVDSASPAYSGELSFKQKVTIRFGFTNLDNCNYRIKQHTIICRKKPITRRNLAVLIAQEVRQLVDALERSNTPLTVEGRPLKFEDLILVDVKRMSTASVQPTIGILMD